MNILLACGVFIFIFTLLITIINYFDKQKDIKILFRTWRL
jgi:hypothetical protein